MKKRHIITCLIILAVLLIGIGIYLYLHQTNPKLEPKELEDCVNLRYGEEGGVNIVIFGDNQKEAEKYVDYFLKVEPFDENSEKFNFYYIGGYKPECELYKNIALLCYSKEIIKKSSSCPNDQIIVLNKDFGTNIRSSSYINVMSINTNHPLSVLAHEFGHSFVNLAEEYVPASISRNSAGNCVDDCSKFNGNNDGCYEGCSEATYYRSIENGVMRTLSSDDYGTFNKLIITKKIAEITKSIKGSAISGNIIRESCSDKNYYLIGAYLENREINIYEKEIARGCIGDSGTGQYSIDLILSDGSRYNIGKFNPESIYTDALLNDLNEIWGEIYTSDKIFYLKVPIIENAKELQIGELGSNDEFLTGIKLQAPFANVANENTFKKIFGKIMGCEI